MRWILLLMLLLGFGAAQAQRECTSNLSEDECELYLTALENFANSDDDFRYWYFLDSELRYGGNEVRTMQVGGIGTLRRNDNQEIDYFEMTVSVYSRYNDALALRPPYSNDYYGASFIFEDGTISLRTEEEEVSLTELNFDTLPVESFFPSLHPEMPIEELYTNPPTINRPDVVFFSFAFNSDIFDNVFRLYEPILFGQHIDDITGTGFYQGGIAVDSESAEIVGLVFDSIAFLDGESFNEEMPVVLTINYRVELRYNRDTARLYPVDNEESDDGRYEDVIAYGPMGLLAVAINEPLEDLYPPILDEGR